MQGLKAYNKFLTRNLSIQLDEPKIYSKILSTHSIDDNAIISSFDDYDKLKPVICFTNFTGKDELVLQVTKVQIIKEWVEFLVAILPIVLSVLAALLPTYFNPLKNLVG
jgi:hypothetical protein